MQLKELLRHLPDHKLIGASDREIKAIAYDSRRVGLGTAFVAIPGHRRDGHEYIHSAVERGAAAVICERDTYAARRAATVIVPDARRAMAELAAVFHGNPSQHLQVIGVAGSTGKTTVAFLVKRILEAAGVRTGLISTIRHEIGDRIIPSHRSTPESVEVQELMGQMVRAECEACVLEISMEALRDGRVSSTAFDVVVFTNLSGAALEERELEQELEGRMELISALKPRPAKSMAVINIDDLQGRQLAHESQAVVRLTYGLGAEAQVRASEIQLMCSGTRMVLDACGKRVRCELPLPGRHNVYNALAAVGAGIGLNMDLGRMVTALKGMSAIPGRLEAVDEGQPFEVFVDYAHTPVAMEKMLRTVREMTPGRVLLAFGCGGGREASYREEMGHIAGAFSHYTIVTNDNPRDESASAIAFQIESGLRRVRMDGYEIQLDRSIAIETVLRMARPGDTVVIAGKGHETYQEFESTIVPFDDRVYARETLQSLGYVRDAVRRISPRARWEPVAA